MHKGGYPDGKRLPTTKCPTSGKRMLDKKSAITAANSSMILHHIKMRIYPCPDCNMYHLATTHPDGYNGYRQKVTMNDRRRKKSNTILDF